MTKEKLLEFYNKIKEHGMDVSVVRQLRKCTDKQLDIIMNSSYPRVMINIIINYEFGLLNINDQEEIIDIVNKKGQEVIFLGDGVPVYKEKLATMCQVEYSFAPAGFNRQRASSVALLGADMYEKGQTVLADEMEPDYLRLSQAERERKEMEEKKA